MSQKEIEEILRKSKTVAVVGLSRNPDKASYEVGLYLKEHGFRVVPVNPFADQVLGEASYATLLDIPQEIQKIIDVVDIFRPAEDVPPIVDQAIQLKKTHGKPDVIWMQLGIINEQSAEIAKKVGFVVIMNRCIMIEHRHLVSK